jgi:hypothetical protein
MKCGLRVIALVVIFQALPAFAFELKDPEREQRRLKIELEAAPSQVQQNFDGYVQELAAAARRDVESPPQKKDRIKELRAKAMNPIVLFRW